MRSRKYAERDKNYDGTPSVDTNLSSYQLNPGKIGEQFLSSPCHQSGIAGSCVCRYVSSLTVRIAKGEKAVLN